MAGQRARDARVFISYRRDDSAIVAGRIRDRLATDLGKHNVFFDVDSIAPGADFRTAISETLAVVDAVLVVIGERWLQTLVTHRGQDFVQTEIEFALHQTAPVIPVLIDNTPMPGATQLPNSISQLAYLNAAKVRPDPDFHTDMDRLLRSIPARPEPATVAQNTEPSAEPSTKATNLPWTDTGGAESDPIYLDISDFGPHAHEQLFELSVRAAKRREVVQRVMRGETVRVFYRTVAEADADYRAMRTLGAKVTPSRNIHLP